MYEIIETMLPGSKKIEIFARNHNLRHGWFSLGNQLGDLYNKWVNVLNCNSCDKAIRLNNRRFKSKKRADFDICEECFIKEEDKEGQEIKA